jgi:GntR family transcriptional regulator
LEKKSIPLYLQLEQVIKSKILIGEFMPGDQIPTEKDLCNTYKVSNVTTRQAILNLVNEGLLFRRQGKGTFVKEGLKNIKNIKTLRLRGDLEDIIPEGVSEQIVDVLSIVQTKSPKLVVKRLNLSEEDTVVQVRRTRRDNSTPESYIRNYLPYEIGKKVKKTDLEKNTMLHVLSNKLGISIKGGTQYIGALVADYDIASALKVNISSPILYFETLIFGKKNKPIDYAQTFYRPDYLRVNVELFFNKRTR